MLISWELLIKSKSTKSSNRYNHSNNRLRSLLQRNHLRTKNNCRSSNNEKRWGKTASLTKKAVNLKSSQMRAKLQSRIFRRFRSTINRGHDGVKISKNKLRKQNLIIQICNRMTTEMMILKALIVTTILLKLACKNDWPLPRKKQLERLKRSQNPIRISLEFTQIATTKILNSSLGTRHTQFTKNCSR